MLLIASLTLGNLVEHMIVNKIHALEIDDSSFPPYQETLPKPDPTPDEQVDIIKTLDYIIKSKRSEGAMAVAYPVYREIQSKINIELPYLIDDLTWSAISKIVPKTGESVRPTITIIDAILQHIDKLNIFSAIAGDHNTRVTCIIGVYVVRENVRLYIVIEGNTRNGNNKISMFDPYDILSELVIVSYGNVFDKSTLKNGLDMAFAQYPDAHNYRFQLRTENAGTELNSPVPMTMTKEILEEEYTEIKLYSDSLNETYDDRNVQTRDLNWHCTFSIDYRNEQCRGGGAKKRVFLAKLNKKELQERAKALNIKGVSKMNKADLILAIRKKR